MASHTPDIWSRAAFGRGALMRALWVVVCVGWLLAWGASCGPDVTPAEPSVDAGPADVGAAELAPELARDAGPQPDARRPLERASGSDSELSPEVGGQEQTKPEPGPDGFDFDRALQRFTTKYQLSLLQRPSFPVKTRHGDINGSVVAASDIKVYARLFFPEWDLYPPALIKKIMLKSVAFCTDLSFAGQARTAIPDMENHVLYLDVKRGFYSNTYVRRTIHHELFHFIDFYDDWKLYQDDEWAALNPKGFTYQSGGKNAQGSAQASLITDAHPGFFTTYSMSGVEEDKAEVFSVLIVLSAIAQAREKKDPIIAAKIARMKQLLVRFVPEVDETFWAAAAQLRRDP